MSRRFLDFLALLIVYLAFNKNIVSYNIEPRDVNSRPIIGVLVQEANIGLGKFGRTVLPASYVKFVEASGGRVVPILIGKSNDYYEKLFYSINGMLMTGGWVSYTDSGYAKSAKIITELAKESNRRGDVFPIWGTCLGFETMTYLLSGKDILEFCETWDMATPLNFTSDYKESKLFGNMPELMQKDMSTLPISINYHRSCVTLDGFKKHGLDKTMHLLSTNTDYNGTEFVSTIESKEFPFYATQWHPEKILFEFVSRPISLKNTPHFARAVEIAQWFSRFFIDNARKSAHSFRTVEEENSLLIYNYKTTFSALQCSMYEEIYIITPNWFSSPYTFPIILILTALILCYVFLWRKGRSVSVCFSSYFPSRKYVLS